MKYSNGNTKQNYFVLASLVLVMVFGLLTHSVSAATFTSTGIGQETNIASYGYEYSESRSFQNTNGYTGAGSGWEFLHFGCLSPNNSCRVAHELDISGYVNKYGQPEQMALQLYFNSQKTSEALLDIKNGNKLTVPLDTAPWGATIYTNEKAITRGKSNWKYWADATVPGLSYDPARKVITFQTWTWHAEGYNNFPTTTFQWKVLLKAPAHPPTVDVPVLYNMNYGQQQPPIQFTGHDTDAGDRLKFFYSFDSATYDIPVTGDFANGEATPTIWPPQQKINGQIQNVTLSFGAHVLYVKVVDKTGYESTNSVAFTLIQSPPPPVISYALTITKQGTGTGVVYGTPKSVFGGFQPNCGGICSSTLLQGKSKTLNVTPDPGSTFAGWGGACASTPATSTTCTVTFDADKNVIALFTKIPPAPKPGTIHVTANRAVTGVTVRGPQSYQNVSVAQNQVVTVDAQAPAGQYDVVCPSLPATALNQTTGISGTLVEGGTLALTCTYAGANSLKLTGHTFTRNGKALTGTLVGGNSIGGGTITKIGAESPRAGDGFSVSAEVKDTDGQVMNNLTYIWKVNGIEKQRSQSRLFSLPQLGSSGALTVSVEVDGSPTTKGSLVIQVPAIKQLEIQ
ncbi:MAG: hypothetical protein WC045_04175 [Patescibacteria group bacterium]